MRVTGIRAEFMKRLSDHDYGFEQASVQYVVELEDGDDPERELRDLVSRGRAQVERELVGRDFDPERVTIVFHGEPDPDDTPPGDYDPVLGVVKEDTGSGWVEPELPF